MKQDNKISNIEVLRAGCNTELEVNFECEQHGGNCCQSGNCCLRVTTPQEKARL